MRATRHSYTLLACACAVLAGCAGEGADWDLASSNTLALEAGAERAFSVIVPRGATFHAMVSPEMPDAATGLVAELAVRDRRGTESLLLRRPLSGPAGAARASLSRWEGQRIELVLRARGTGAGRMRWERPRISGAPFDRQRDVVLIVVDTLRADHVGAYGGSARTPNIDRLAARGVSFRNARAQAPLTAPSHAALLASVRAAALGVRNNQDVLPDSATTLAEVLQATGRRTSAFVSLGVLGARFGTAQGFDEYHDRFGRDWWKSAGEVNAELLPWLRQLEPGPMFLWVHYSDPHEPYAAADVEHPRIRVAGKPLEARVDGSTLAVPLELPPGRTAVRIESAPNGESVETWIKDLRALDPAIGVECASGCSDELRFDGTRGPLARPPFSIALDNPTAETIATELRFRPQRRLDVEGSRAAYRAEVEYCDREIGRLLDALDASGRLDRALVILTSDHGEGLGHHGLMGHVHQLYDTLLRVPLLVSMPGVLAAGAIVEEPVGLVDVLPTVLDLLHVPDATGREGRSLVPLVTGVPDLARPLYAETFEPQARKDLAAVVSGRHKLIEADDGRWLELYDLERDPAETKNLGARRWPTTRRLQRMLRSHGAASTPRAAPEPPDPRDLERLRSLGYVR